MFSGEADNVELLLQQYFAWDRYGDEAKWEKARILVELVKYRSAKWIGIRIGKSPTYIHMMLRTYNAFPEEKNRKKELSFSHHYLAAKAEIGNPNEWIEIAAKERLSVRGFQERIRGPKDPAPSFKQIIMDLQIENDQLRKENERLKSIIKAISQKIGQVA